MRFTRACSTFALVAVALTLAGTAEAATSQRWGSLDDSFGQGGHVASALPPAFNRGAEVSFPNPPAKGYGESEFRSLAIATDGALLVLTKHSSANGTVRRFRPDGSLDSDFGANGVFVPAANLDAEGMIVDAAGRIVLAGSNGGYLEHPVDYLFRRYSPNGAPDSSFGAGGVTAVHFDDEVQPVDLAGGPDGGTVLLGNSPGRGTPSRGGATVLVRLDPGGAPVAGFGHNGVLAVEPARPPLEVDPEAAQGEALVVGAGGRIVVAGTSGDAMLAARSYGGGAEPAFGAGRSSVLEAGNRPSTTEAFGLISEPDGELLASISTNAYRRNPGPGLLPLTPDGSPAAAVGEPLRYLPVSASGQLFADGEHRLIVLDGQFEVARIDRTGRLDRSFGSEGFLRLLIAGITGVHQHLALACLLANGRLDRSFGDGGQARRRVGYVSRASLVVRQGGVIRCQRPCPPGRDSSSSALRSARKRTRKAWSEKSCRGW